MKKSVLLIIPLLLASCTKQNTEVKITDKDSLSGETHSAVKPKDSVASSENRDSLKVSATNKMGEAVKIIDAEKLPSTIDQTFDDKIQKLIIRIPNYSKSKLHGVITPKNNNMNVRFNQIKLSDGTYDGPFGRDISYDIKGKGEIWLIIGKDLMAEGENTGQFSVTID
ncbi:hypothetical protein [Chryseobacterium sp. RR2-3-20]|uniref:hypothetical protein n=1 Tax=Chryseobacterium sp. RR2-3-20 TaxID=2787626 RepID=UPI001ADFF576|nr:hypothetical protein [Chryseobacterium sp. RR2-3-20]